MADDEVRWVSLNAGKPLFKETQINLSSSPTLQ